MNFKTLDINLKIEQHEHHYQPYANKIILFSSTLQS